MSKITFQVNGEEYSASDEITSGTRLVDYLRTRLELRGTKFNCREGSCGACIVAAVTKPGEPPKSVNSCLVSVASCHGWAITTIEGIGNWRDGYHPAQRTLADKHGTQCGYCSPGWVMAMYCILKSGKKMSKLDIEKAFASNICRCTGYRPIMDAQKTFATDALESSELPDIEDLRLCKKNKEKCAKTSCSEQEWCFVTNEDYKQNPRIELDFKDGKKWYIVENVSDILDIWSIEGDKPYMLVAGNTAKGVYPIDDYPEITMDIARVSELKGHTIDQNLIIGACTPIGEVMDVFKELSSSEDYFEYLEIVYDHLGLVAHIPVKNVGTIGGNLMVKHEHNEFPSDVFLLLETVGANVTILSSDGEKEIMSMQKFLKTDMHKKLLYNVILPPYSENYHFVTYKIMPRAQNAYAHVNAGFMYKMEGNIVQECRMVFGNIHPGFVRASETESLLLGKDLFNNETLKLAVNSLKKEIQPEERPPEPSAKYRKKLAIGLFYKGLLHLCPSDKLNPRYVSGAIDYNKTRPVSSGHQEYSSDPAFYPVNKPVHKVEGLIQCSGEAKYTDDEPSLKREVYAAYATTKVALGKIDSIDASEALKVPGVIAFYTAKDIPGSNNFIALGILVFAAEEEVLCSGNVKHYDQPYGIVVAQTMDIAERAAKLVKATYSNVKKPVIDIKEAKKDPSRCELFLPIPAIKRGVDVAKVIKNEYTVYGQYHFFMEPIACVTTPTGEGLKVYSTTQWTDGVQICVSRALNIHQSKVDVCVRRLGGGFGGKISRASQTAVACALVTHKLNRPCRFIQSLTSCMRSIGKRLPCSTTLEFGVNRKGEIQYMNYEIYEDVGYINSELMAILGVDCYSNCYDKLKWNYKCYDTRTDTPKNSYCRAPGAAFYSTPTNILVIEIGDKRVI